MVLPHAMAWVQYWFRVLSLKFCGKSKKICGDISQLSPAFCMYGSTQESVIDKKNFIGQTAIWSIYNRKVLFVTKNDHFAQWSQIKFFSGFHCYSWFQVGCSWFQISFHGFSWFKVGFSWFQVGFHVLFMVLGWFFMVLHGSRLVFMVFRGSRTSERSVRPPCW